MKTDAPGSKFRPLRSGVEDAVHPTHLRQQDWGGHNLLIILLQPSRDFREAECYLTNQVAVVVDMPVSAES